MEQLYKDKYVHFVYDEQNLMLHEYWTTATEDLEVVELKNIMLALVTIFKQHKINKLLAHATDFKFEINAEMQTWIDQTVAPHAISSGIKKIARIMSADFVAQFTLEQFSEEKIVSGIETRFFDNETDATRWLLS